MKLGFKRPEKGFTLVELMVVMVILAILAAVVISTVSGSEEVSEETQVIHDANTVGSAMNKFRVDQGVETLTAGSSDLLGNSNDPSDEAKSSRWPENFVTTIYSGLFATADVGAIVIKDKDGDIIDGEVAILTVTNSGAGYSFAPDVNFTGGGGSGAEATAVMGTGGDADKVVSVTITNPGSGYTSAPAISFTGGGTGDPPAEAEATLGSDLSVFVNVRTAVDFNVTDFVPDYSPTVPASADEEIGVYYKYLWLAKKSTSLDGTAYGARVLEVYEFTSITEVDSKDVLVYQQIY